MNPKLLTGVALFAALGAGATVGLFLGVPALSGAQTPAPTPSASGSPVPGAGHRGFLGLGLKGGGASLDVAAKDLTMTPAELKTALKGGQSIAALARSKNVDPQKIINDLVADATTRIDAAVTSGKITAAMAMKLKGNLTAGITAFVNGTRLPRVPGVTGTAVPKLGPGRIGIGPSLDIVAKDLTMTVPQLKTALQGGQSIAALAKSKNVDPQKIINDLVADATTRIDAAVTSGKITAAMATKIKAGLSAAITGIVNGTGGGLGHGFPGPLGGVFGRPFGGPGGQGRRPTSTATPASI
jgi:urease accessory protein UreF